MKERKSKKKSKLIKFLHWKQLQYKAQRKSDSKYEKSATLAQRSLQYIESHIDS